MITKNGVMVNAVYGFTSMLLKVWKVYSRIVLRLRDMAGPTFRHVQYKEYKGTREGGSGVV